MEIKKIKQESTQNPSDITIRHLSGTIYEFISNENIELKNKIIDGIATPIYESDMTHITASIHNYDEMVVALIRLKYTQDAEFALINKGIQNANDIEYVNYRNYVNMCKEKSKL